MQPGEGCKVQATRRGCVEIANLPNGGRALRDSKYLTGLALRFTAAEWSAFTAGVRAGEFD